LEDVAQRVRCNVSVGAMKDGQRFRGWRREQGEWMWRWLEDVTELRRNEEAC